MAEALRMAREGNGADRQRRRFARGGIPGVVRGLIEETATAATSAAPVAA
jgi:hypothetical protein